MTARPDHDDLEPEPPGVLLVAHGSLVEPESGRGARLLAAALCEAGFEARCAFWKEQPSLREAWATLAARRVVIVPLFAATGWFSRMVVPRELGLAPGTAVVRVGTRELVLTEPLGAHPQMADLVAARAAEALAGLDPHRTALVVVGHGTERSPHSAQTVVEHAARLRNRALACVVEVAFLDQEPSLATLHARLDGALTEVVLVPCLIADGPHTRADIPAALGLPEHTDDTVTRAPSERFPGRTLHYTSAAGTRPELAGLVHARIREGLHALSDAPPSAPGAPTEPLVAFTPEAVAEARTRLRSALEGAAVVVVGQSAVSRQGDTYWIQQVASAVGATADEGAEGSPRLRRLAELVELTERTPAGGYRALRTARDRETRWRFHTHDFAHLVDALEILEPAALTLAATPTAPLAGWHACAARHTGLLAGMRERTFDEVAALVASLCTPTCTRHPAWHHAVEPSCSTAPRCPEPCPMLRAAGAHVDAPDR